jgi:hypothetical protein
MSGRESGLTRSGEPDSEENDDARTNGQVRRHDSGRGERTRGRHAPQRADRTASRRRTCRGLLEPDARKRARPVLRGAERSNALGLPDQLMREAGAGLGFWFRSYAIVRLSCRGASALRAKHSSGARALAPLLGSEGAVRCERTQNVKSLVRSSRNAAALLLERSRRPWCCFDGRAGVPLAGGAIPVGRPDLSAGAALLAVRRH